MNRLNKYRKNGAIGALLDEYEKSISALILVIEDIKECDLIKIVDTKTKDEDCKSIQSILSHTILSGYNYVIEIRKWLGEEIMYKSKPTYTTTNQYIDGLKTMFQYNEKLFSDHPNIKIETHETDKKLVVRWGQTYDVEQLLEHAIVHILRHRRQIEKFKLILDITPFDELL
ncbi:MAG: DinB family protein [Saprospiraceae bacterium]